MRTTIAPDDDLVARAQAFTGLTERIALVREALKALIEREAARRPDRLCGRSPIWNRHRSCGRPRRDPG